MITIEDDRDSGYHWLKAIDKENSWVLGMRLGL